MIAINLISIKHKEIKVCFHQVFEGIFNSNINFDCFQIFTILTYANPWILGILMYGFKIKGIVYYFIIINSILITILLNCYFNIA